MLLRRNAGQRNSQRTEDSLDPPVRPGIESGAHSFSRDSRLSRTRHRNRCSGAAAEINENDPSKKRSCGPRRQRRPNDMARAWFKSRSLVRRRHMPISNIWDRTGVSDSICWGHWTRVLVGRRGHYLNSRIELGGGVLDLLRTHCDSRGRATLVISSTNTCPISSAPAKRWDRRSM
jgi:hypothetical protein